MNRYNQFSEIIKASQGKRRFSTFYYPNIPRKSTDVYVIAKASDRLDIMANDYYGDPRYWIVIARANKLYNGTIKPPVGDRLRIPFPLNRSEFSQLFRDE